MPQWAGSCWYYLRYLDAQNDSHSSERTLKTTGWARSPRPGSRPHHARRGSLCGRHGARRLHLLYARFWHKVLFDLGYVSTPEPFFKLVNQGLILGEMEFTGF